MKGDEEDSLPPDRLCKKCSQFFRQKGNDNSKKPGILECKKNTRKGNYLGKIKYSSPL